MSAESSVPIRPYLQKLQNLTEVLEESENQRQKIIEFMKHAPCLCFMKSAETGKYEYVNNAMCEVMKMHTEAVLGKTDWELFSAEAAMNYISYDVRVLKEKKPVVVILSFDNKMYIIAKFLVINGSTSIGGFGLELPASFTLEQGKEEPDAKPRA